MSEIQAFNFNDNEIRVVQGPDNEPWFVAKDVCDVLGLEQVTRAVARLDEDEVTNFKVIDSIGRMQDTNIINESGLYSLIIRSNKPEANAFRKWVTSEVLPSIRKHGAYMTPMTIQDVIDNPDLAIELLTKLKFEREQKALMEKQRNEAIETKAWIGHRREATAMATASVQKRRAETLAIENESLAEQVGDSTNWKAVKSIGWLLDYFPECQGMWSAVGKRLKAISNEMHYDVKKIEDSKYGHVNVYHVDVVKRFRAKVEADPNLMNKYRYE